MEQAALADLSARLRIPPAEIQVLSAQAVIWPDASLGCPQSNESYSPTQVEGFRVLLLYEERMFIYHAGADGQPFLCSSDEPDGGHHFVPPPGIDE